VSLACTLIENSASFEWRGPYHSLTRVDGDKIEVLRSKADWGSVVGDKPVTDLRSNNLADLFPRPRAVLSRVMAGLESENVPKKVSGPKL